MSLSAVGANLDSSEMAEVVQQKADLTGSSLSRGEPRAGSHLGVDLPRLRNLTGADLSGAAFLASSSRTRNFGRRT